MATTSVKATDFRSEKAHFKKKFASDVKCFIGLLAIMVLGICCLVIEHSRGIKAFDKPDLLGWVFVIISTLVAAYWCVKLLMSMRPINCFCPYCQSHIS